MKNVILNLLLIRTKRYEKNNAIQNLLLSMSQRRCCVEIDKLTTSKM